MGVMRKIILGVFLVMSVCVYSQKTSTSTAVKTTVSQDSKHNERVDSMLNRLDTLVQVTNMWLEQIELDHSLKNRYKLYQTENIYTLLKLDTKTGRIEQVQWSLDSNKEGTMTINDVDLTYGYGKGSNSFELYPTKNMYQFILINKTDGKMWHVQWGMEKSKRWIQRIY